MKIFLYLFFIFFICDSAYGITNDLQIARKNWVKLSNTEDTFDVKELARLKKSLGEGGHILVDLPLVDEAGNVKESALTHSLVRIKKAVSSDLSQKDREVISRALRKILNLYHVDAEKVGNWWHWEIGTPKQINQVLLRSKNWLDSDIYEGLLAASHHFLPRAGFQNYGLASTGTGFSNSGANRVDTVLIVLQRAILEGDEAVFKATLDKLWEVIEYVESGDGFYRDGGFIQHKDIPYIGTYGLVLFEGLNQILTILKGTSWQPNDYLYHRVLDRYESHLLPFVVDGVLLDLVSGRGSSRGWAQGDWRGRRVHSLLNTFQELSSPNVARRAELLEERLVKKDDQYHAFIFNSIDRFLYRAPKYTSAISMHSSRIGNYECTNGENRKGWYTGDGMHYLQLHKKDYIDSWPLVDFSSPPGTTTNAQGEGLCDAQSNYYHRPLKSQSWVGGTVLEDIASVGMDYESFGGKVKAKKSWFYMPDLILSLGSDIKGAKLTNVFQRFSENFLWEELIRNRAYWLRDLDRKTSIGVFLPFEQHSVFQLSNEEGDWKDINEQTPLHMSDSKIESSRAKFDLLHNVEKNTYAYVLLPNQTLSETKHFAANPNVDILSIAPDLHACWFRSHKTLLVNSFNSKPKRITDWLTVTGAASLIVKFEGERVLVSLSEPPRDSKKIELLFRKKIIDVSSFGDRIHVEGSLLTIDTSGLSGQSVTFSFSLRN